MTSVTKGMETALLWKTCGGGFIACRHVATITVFERVAKGGAYPLRVSVLDLVKFRFFFSQAGLTSSGFRNVCVMSGGGHHARFESPTRDGIGIERKPNDQGKESNHHDQADEQGTDAECQVNGEEDEHRRHGAYPAMEEDHEPGANQDNEQQPKQKNGRS